MAKFAIALCTLVVCFAAGSEAVVEIQSLVRSSTSNLISYYSTELNTLYDPIRNAYLYGVSNSFYFSTDNRYYAEEILNKHDKALTSGGYSAEALACADSTLNDKLEQILSAADSCYADITAKLSPAYEEFSSSWGAFKTFLDSQDSLLSNCWASDDVARCGKEVLHEVSSTGDATWVQLFNQAAEVLNYSIDWVEIPVVCGFDVAKAAFQAQADASVAAVQKCAA